MICKHHNVTLMPEYLINSLPVLLINIPLPRLLPSNQGEAVTGVNHVGALHDVGHPAHQ